MNIVENMEEMTIEKMNNVIGKIVEEFENEPQIINIAIECSKLVIDSFGKE